MGGNTSKLKKCENEKNNLNTQIEKNQIIIDSLKTELERLNKEKSKNENKKSLSPRKSVKRAPFNSEAYNNALSNHGGSKKSTKTRKKH